MSESLTSAAPLEAGLLEADLERRFGGLRRLFGAVAYGRLRAARIAVVGVGGVGSWAAEALARSGVAGLTLIDLDHVGESNINRQIHALESTLGQAKVQALKERIALIHPGCEVHAIEEFVDEANAHALLSVKPLDGIVECCDQVRAKAAVAAWGWAHGVPVVAVGAAGGKVWPHQVQLADLSAVTHDPLLSSLRQRLRQRHGGARRGPMDLTCVFSKEPVRPPQDGLCDLTPDEGPDSLVVAEENAGRHETNLNCHGFGSTVTVTATFGMVAAAELVQRIMAPAPAA